MRGRDPVPESEARTAGLRPSSALAGGGASGSLFAFLSLGFCVCEMELVSINARLLRGCTVVRP